MTNRLAGLLAVGVACSDSVAPEGAAPGADAMAVNDAASRDGSTRDKAPVSVPDTGAADLDTRDRGGVDSGTDGASAPMSADCTPVAGEDHLLCRGEAPPDWSECERGGGARSASGACVILAP